MPKRLLNRLKTWLEHLGLPELTAEFTHNSSWAQERIKICEMHFHPIHITLRGRQKLLTFDALPIKPTIDMPSTSQNARETGEDVAGSSRAKKSGVIIEAIPISPQKRPSPSSPPLSKHRRPAEGVNASDHNEFIPENHPEERANSKPKLKKQKRPLCNKLAVRSSNNILKNILQLLERVKHRFSSTSYLFIQSQLKAARVEKMGRRWSPEIKEFSTTIHYTSPAAYRELYKNFSLPSPSTLQRFMHPELCDVGFTEAHQRFLIPFINALKEDDKLCALAFDEVWIIRNFQYNLRTDSIDGFTDLGRNNRTKQEGKQVLVFSLKGLKSNWKHPLCYFISPKSMSAVDLQRILFDILDHLHRLGLDVFTLICDQGQENQTLRKNLGVTTTQPYFKHQ